MKLPNDTQHISIVGRNGSGKSQAAVWHLANRSWDRKPWIIYDYKMDGLINSIPQLKTLDIEQRPPREPGLYVVHPHPSNMLGLERQLTEVWQQEDTGVYVDEGYMVCPSDRPNAAFRLLLTQGRSKHCPLIINSQRPVWLDRFVFTESTFFQVFALNDRRDRATMGAFIPADMEEPLKPYYSYYHDVAKNQTVILSPVPDAETILRIYTKRQAEIETARLKELKKNRVKVLAI